MMGTMSLGSSIAIRQQKLASLAGCDNNYTWLSKRNFKCLMNCHNEGNVGRNNNINGVSSILTKRSALVNVDPGTALLDTENLVLTPNGKDLVSYNDATNGNSVMGMNDDDGIGIINVLKGKGFFVTGATGFLGKVFIEKILRTVPDVGKIYILIKAKNADAAMERLKIEIINIELFKSLQQTYGKSYQSFMLSKLVPVIGNVCETNLGLDEDTADVIAKDVDIIVNSAANTTFDERYDVALDTNTGGPSRLMSFAKRCKKLNLFLQLSTAYVNGQRQGRIMEKPFNVGETIARESLMYGNHTQKLNVEDEIKMVLESKKFLGENALVQKLKELGLERYTGYTLNICFNFCFVTVHLKSLTKHLAFLRIYDLTRAKLYGWQDTYVFTKAMGEMMINKMRGDIPVVIIRPSVIESTYKEPFPGWMEGNRMMDPIVLYYGKGQLSGFLVDPNGVLDVVPADMVVNATMAAMAKHIANIENEENYIYHIASSVVNPLVFKDLASLLYEHFNSSPCLDLKGRPVHVPVMQLYRSMEEFSAHIWKDAMNRTGLASSASTNNGKLTLKLENICKKSVEQAKYLANIYEPYTFYGGRFDNSNTQKLFATMSEEEKKTFGFDVEKIDWRDYISNVHIPGLRRHVMKGRGMCT
ncbi:fatty acyl-CoA reductase 2, chloroplastic-like [Bidens hawaiensis]|uniref:fatty acyl-CoA reductase 2, chloroplastic-like n=1 Tax=Bidens hawaiensis TaxID=980011 RepID=UPI00404B0751